jgi:alpha-L-fucosidase
MKKMILVLLIALTCKVYSQTDESFNQFWSDAQKLNWTDKSKTSQLRMKWWLDSRFGMFIHWNPSSLSASEISWSKQFYDDNGELLQPNPRPDAGFSGMKEHTEWLSWFKPAVPKEVYDNLYKSFYPGMFDADKIVSIAKEAGMKYIVMIAKHHDGFCMWNSKYTDFDIMNTPFHRDILKEMAAATHKAGLKFGIYYSQRDWHHQAYKPESMAEYNMYMKNQLNEILSNYGEISVLFFDSHEWKTFELWEGKELFKLAYKLQPNIIINDRCGVPADYTTPEQKIGQFNKNRNWESNMTFTGFWSWHGFQTPVIPYEKCLENLIRCAGGNGNLLLNVGPMPTGQIDPREEDRLKKIGGWLSKNGESIYTTKGGPFLPDSSWVSTYKVNRIYIHLLNLTKVIIELPGIRETIVKAEILNGPSVSFIQKKDKIILHLPSEENNEPVKVILLTLNQNLNENQIPVK